MKRRNPIGAIPMGQIQATSGNKSRTFVRCNIDQSNEDQRGRSISGDIQDNFCIAKDFAFVSDLGTVEFKGAERIQRLVAREIAKDGEATPVPRGKSDGLR
jgi:hypothetical protein